MKKTLYLLILMAAMGALILVPACSDDDNGTGPGDADIEALMRTQISQDMDAIVTSLIFGLSQFEGFDNDPGFDDLFSKRNASASPQDSLDYQYTEDGWHALYLERDDQMNLDGILLDYDLTLSDSIQFREDDIILQYPGDSADYLHYIIWMDMMLNIDADDTSLTVNIDEYHIDCIFDKQPEDDALVSGDLDLDYTVTAVAGADRGTGNVVYSIDITSLELTQPYGCPESGVLSADLSVDFQGTAGEADGNWTAVVTFLGNNQARVQLTGPGYSFDWTKTFECGDDVVASPIPFGAFIPSNR
ncbi:MAG: hypothetical protein GF310_11710 [candidate division Zixibacteria bacterium]|nr:hypothetical protein [candidate division Zixibacteria bacterium]